MLSIGPAQRGQVQLHNHVDLFCGPGGFATGFGWAGFETLAGIDIHAPSLSTYAANHRDAKTLLADIRSVSVSDVVKLAGATNVDVLSAGVPCEGFSMSNRNRTKFTDDRNFLFIEFLRIAEGIKPKVLLVENVANLARHDGGVFAQEIEAGMRALGYETTSTILNALDFGVPQRRRRIMFIGVLPGTNFKWPKATHGNGPGLKPPVTVGDALIGDLPELESNESSVNYAGPPKTPYQKFIRGKQKTLLNHQAPNHPESTIDMIRRTAPGAPMYAKFKQRIRLQLDAPSPTVVSGGIRPQFAYGHPTQARGLSIRERARLMSFPDSYEFLGGLTQGRVQTGDAVPPLLAQAVAIEISNAIEGATHKNESDIGRVHVSAITE
ncbi:MAG: DNA cytosine methyltransferase [Actinobacteria bacterium]|nr:DNA cytosine methyltransferase [Actinomycetota bacterium]